MEKPFKVSVARRQIAADIKKHGERTAARDHSLKAKTKKGGVYSQPG